VSCWAFGSAPAAAPLCRCEKLGCTGACKDGVGCASCPANIVRGPSTGLVELTEGLITVGGWVSGGRAGAGGRAVGRAGGRARARVAGG
jgi:hypothetical protein